MPLNISPEQAQALVASGQIRADQAAALAGVQSPAEAAGAQPAVAGMAPSLPKVDAPAPAPVDLPPAAPPAPDARLAMNTPAGGGPDVNDPQAVASFMGLPQRGMAPPSPAALDSGGMGAAAAGGGAAPPPVAPPGDGVAAAGAVPPAAPAPDATPPLTPMANPAGLHSPLKGVAGMAHDPRVQALSNDAQFAAQSAQVEGRSTAALQDSQRQIADIQSSDAHAMGALEKVRATRGDEAYGMALSEYKQAQAAQAKLETMNTGTDSSWHNKSTGAKVGYIALSIGSMLLPFLQPAVRALDRSAEEDVAQQRAAYEQQKQSVEGHTSLYSKAFELTGSADQAAKTATNALLGQQEQKLGALAAKYKGTQAGENYLAAQIHVQQGISQRNAELALTIAHERKAAAAAAQHYADARSDKAAELALEQQKVDATKNTGAETARHNQADENIRLEEKKRELAARGKTPAELEAEKDAADEAEYVANEKAVIDNLDTAGRTRTGAWKQMTNAPLPEAWQSDDYKLHKGAVGALAKLVKSKGDNSDTDFNMKDKPQLPEAGDSDAVKADKTKKLLAVFYANHAAQKLKHEAKQTQVAANLGVGPAQ